MDLTDLSLRQIKCWSSGWFPLSWLCGPNDTCATTPESQSPR